MGLLTKIRKPEPEQPQVIATTVADDPRAARPAEADAGAEIRLNQLPPPTACLVCECPAIWISIYDMGDTENQDRWRCCDCDPPPAWPFVGRRLLLVVTEAGELGWEVLPRVHQAGADGPVVADRDGGGGAVVRAAESMSSSVTAAFGGLSPPTFGWQPYLTGGRRRHAPIAPERPPPEILAKPLPICSICHRGRVLPELRLMTGGLCWSCWEISVL